MNHPLTARYHGQGGPCLSNSTGVTAMSGSPIQRDQHRRRRSQQLGELPFARLRPSSSTSRGFAGRGTMGERKVKCAERRTGANTGQEFLQDSRGADAYVLKFDLHRSIVGSAANPGMGESTAGTPGDGRPALSIVAEPYPVAGEVFIRFSSSAIDMPAWQPSPGCSRCSGLHRQNLRSIAVAKGRFRQLRHHPGLFS